MFAMGQHADEGGGPRLARERGTIITVIAVIGLSIVAWVASSPMRCASAA